MFFILMHGRCCCWLTCFFPDIPRDVCAVTGGPDLIIHVSYMYKYYYLMTISQNSSFVVRIFTLLCEVQYTLVFKDVVVKFRKQHFMTILKNWCPSSSKRFLMEIFLLSSSRGIVLPDYLLFGFEYRKDQTFHVETLLFSLPRLFFFSARLCSLFPCHAICIVFGF